LKDFGVGSITNPPPHEESLAETYVIVPKPSRQI
jgi:hypothetical protein